jgi:ATP-dependent DNA helicase HFM1/MER3
MLQQPFNDRQYQAAQGRGRLSLAPARNRSYGSHTIESPRPPLQSLPVYQETYGDEGNTAHSLKEHILIVV